MSGLQRRHLFGIATLLTCLSLASAAQAQGSSGAVPRVAISGYDPVSYFEVHHPEQGSAAYTASFDDTTYWFVSAEHRALFVANPDKYAPLYDGYCAMAVTIGQKLEPNPKSWAINDGKLYLFGEPPPGLPPAVPYFQQHTAEVVQAGHETWPRLRRQP